MFTCIKIAWDRVENIFARVLTIIATIWRPGFRVRTSFSVLKLMYLTDVTNSSKVGPKLSLSSSAFYWNQKKKSMMK